MKTPSKSRPQRSPSAAPPSALDLSLAAVPQSRRSRLACHAAAGAIALGMVIGVIWMSEQDVLWPREDCFSDMNALMAGENFASNGFGRLHFLPVHYVPSVGERPNYYTHYPPLPDVVSGLVRVAGGRSLAAQRTVFGLVGVAGWLLLYLAVARRLGALAGVMGLAFVATSGFFFTYGVSVHTHCLNTFFVGLFLAVFLRATDQDRPRWWLWAVCWGAALLESLTSFEFIPYMQAVAWLYVLATGQFRRRWKVLLVLAAAPVVGVGLHFLQNVWATGWQATRGDFLGYGQYGESYWSQFKLLPTIIRTNVLRCFDWVWGLLPVSASACLAAVAIGGAGTAPKPGVAGASARRKSALAAALAGSLVATCMAVAWGFAQVNPADPFGARNDPFALMNWFAIAATIAFLLAAGLAWPADAPARKAVALVGAFAIAPLVWYVGMASHAHHPHTVNQVMPLAFAALGGIAALIATRLFKQSTGWPLRSVLLAGVLVLFCVASGQKSALSRRLQPLGPQHPLWPVTIARALGPEAFGDKNGVLFNTTPEAQLEYFLRNCAQLCPMRGLPFPESLPRLQEAIGPDWSYNYYLYFLVDEEPLFEFLKTHCPGKLLAVPLGQGRAQPVAVLFDIRALLLPPDKRPAPDAELLSRLDRQKRNDFDPWVVPGFFDRLAKLAMPPQP